MAASCPNKGLCRRCKELGHTAGQCSKAWNTATVVVTLALYTMLEVRQLFSKGQVVFFRQLHPCVGDCLITVVQYFMVVFLTDSKKFTMWRLLWMAKWAEEGESSSKYFSVLRRNVGQISGTLPSAWRMAPLFQASTIFVPRSPLFIRRYFQQSPSIPDSRIVFSSIWSPPFRFPLETLYYLFFWCPLAQSGIS